MSPAQELLQSARSPPGGIGFAQGPLPQTAPASPPPADVRGLPFCLLVCRDQERHKVLAHKDFLFFAADKYGDLTGMLRRFGFLERRRVWRLMCVKYRLNSTKLGIELVMSRRRN